MRPDLLLTFLLGLSVFHTPKVDREDSFNNKPFQDGLLQDLEFQTCQFMKQAAYRKPDRIAPESDLLPDGAMSPVNRHWDSARTGKWYIEEQRYGFDAVAAGLANDDTIAINRGLRIIKWGFLQQQPDGSFDCPDAFHSTSFFVEASAHALLLLQASYCSKYYQPLIRELKPKIHRAAMWMTNPEVEKEGKLKNIPYTHRRYLVAAALGETGVLTADSFLIGHSSQYIREGMLLQDSSGFNPEKGGYDCSYHCVGLLYAEQYFSMVARGEDKKELFRMLKKGCNWLTTRINPNGTLNPAGNTRTGLGQEKGRNDNIKTINYGAAFRSLYYYSLLSGDPTYGDWAQKLVEGKKIDKM